MASADPVYLQVDCDIPIGEITRALNAFGFSVKWGSDCLAVRYAPEPKTTRTEIVGYSPFEPPITREVPIRDPDEETREEFLEKGWEP